jgi:hypothetical protein
VKKCSICRQADVGPELKGGLGCCPACVAKFPGEVERLHARQRAAETTLSNPPSKGRQRRRQFTGTEVRRRLHLLDVNRYERGLPEARSMIEAAGLKAIDPRPAVEMSAAPEPAKDIECDSYKCPHIPLRDILLATSGMLPYPH